MVLGAYNRAAVEIAVFIGLCAELL